MTHFDISEDMHLFCISQMLYCSFFIGYTLVIIIIQYWLQSHPHAVQYFTAYFIPNTLCLLIPCPCIATSSISPLLTTGFVLYTHKSASILLYSLVYSILLDPTCKFYCTLFIFISLTYFTQHTALQIHPCCRKWQDFLLL